MRLRYVKSAKDTIESNKDICITNPEEYKGKWKEVYPFKKIMIEVGCGKGKFITEMAVANPDTLFIGIEKFDSVICRAIEKRIELDINNAIFVRGDATNLLDWFEKGEVDRVFLSFPDPWPKARHEKRRLSSPRFMDMYKVILNDDGIFRIKTDNVPLYEYSLESTLPYLDNPSYGERIYTDGEITTEFEEKFRKLGNKIYYIEGKIKK